MVQRLRGFVAGLGVVLSAAATDRRIDVAAAFDEPVAANVVAVNVGVATGHGAEVNQERRIGLVAGAIEIQVLDVRERKGGLEPHERLNEGRRVLAPCDERRASGSVDLSNELGMSLAIL